MTSSDIRVRFAPSPTGIPHVGNLRTALFNWAYAKHVGGTFVFRIEDTDLERDSEENYEMLLDAMSWLGLDSDEGVVKGGPYGPYRQSQRMDIYRDIVARLAEGGYTYESYSTPEEIKARNIAAGKPAELGYDGFDRTLSAEQIAAFKAEGREPAIRLRMPDEDISFRDLIRGEVTFKVGSVPDYVIVRPGGQPLYTLTNPADDAMMHITHVLRGEDLLSSTPRQIALYQALIKLGIADGIPAFGHLPYVMGEGNKKLSKRDPSSNLFLHREKGMIPEGLNNYLALLGWSISPDRDVFSMEEMVAAFDIADVNPNSARFDEKKAEAINADHIRMLDPADFRDRLVPYLEAGGVVGVKSFAELPAREQEILSAAAPLVQTRMTLLGEAVGMLGFLFASDADMRMEPEALDQLKPQAGEVLDAAIAVIEGLPGLDAVSAHEALQADLVTRLGLKPREAFTPLRVAVTGRRVSPPLFESMEILGKDSVLARLRSLRARLA